MAVEDEAQIVHLDTKDWIELARGYNGRAHEFRKIAQLVIEKSVSGQAIFPVSIVHFEETVKNANPERKKRLAEYVTLASQGWTIIPASKILDLEIESACLKWHGKPGHDLQSFAIRKGLSHMLGAKATLVDKDPSHPTPEEVKRSFLELLDSPWGLQKSMQIGFSETEIRKMEEDSKATAETLEKSRESHRTINDKRHRHDVIMADYLVNVIGPKLVPFVLKLGLPMTFMIDISRSREKITQFFQSIPTCYCEAQLKLYQTNMQRKIEANDLNDIMSLSVAIPYSDAVITEKMWHDGIRQTKLGELFQTKVLRSAKALPQVLDSN